MRNQVSNSSKGALLFVAVTLVGVAVLIGTEENEGALLQAAADIERQGKVINSDKKSGQTAARQQPKRETNAGHDVGTLEFAAEDDLVDDATGFDPTPEIEAPLVSTEPLIGPTETSAQDLAE